MILIWEKQKLLLLTVGLFYVVGILCFLNFFHQYEVVITDLIVSLLDFALAVEVKNLFSSNFSFGFLIELFSYRTCLLAIVFFILHLLLLLVLLPLYYWINVYLLRAIMHIDVIYRFQRLLKLYKYLFLYIFYKGIIAIVYLLIVFLLSFTIYAGILFTLGIFFVISYFTGQLLYTLVEEISGLQFFFVVEQTDKPKTILILGIFVTAFFLFPLVGWILIPLIHIPAFAYFCKNLSVIKN